MTDRHVVVGVDGSLVAVRALDWAAEEAVLRGAALRIVYAVADRDEAGPVLVSAASRVHERHAGLPVEARAVEGGAVRVLARESEGATLTVVGTRGFSGVSGLLAGSVSWRLAAHMHGPLLVVRGDHPRDEGREVLLGLESDADEAAAAFAYRRRPGVGSGCVSCTPRHTGTPHRSRPRWLPRRVLASSDRPDATGRKKRCRASVSPGFGRSTPGPRSTAARSAPARPTLS